MEAEKKHLFLYAVVALFVFTFCIGQTKASDYENYFGITMNNEEYNNLLNLGFSGEEIYYMDEQTFEDNKSLSASLVSKTEKFYKSIYTDLNGETYSVEITEDEYNNQGTIEPRGTVNTSYKSIVSTMSQVSSKFRYKVSVSWKQMPSTRSYDIIGVGFEDDVYIDSSVYFNYYHCDSSGNCTTSTEYYNKKKLSTGGSAVFKFPSSSRSLSAVLYYDVAKNTTGTITRLDMCGDYAHATSSVSSSNYSGHGITISGISLGSSSGYYDATPCATSSWSGSW